MYMHMIVMDEQSCEMHACDVPVPAHGGLASEHVERRCNDCKDCKS